MRKRQLKKKMKKCLPALADESFLLTMSDDERKQAIDEYEKYVRTYAYRKKYKNLKDGKPLFYYFPVGKSVQEDLGVLMKRGGKRNIPTVSQSLSNLKLPVFTQNIQDILEPTEYGKALMGNIEKMLQDKK